MGILQGSSLIPIACAPSLGQVLGHFEWQPGNTVTPAAGTLGIHAARQPRNRFLFCLVWALALCTADEVRGSMPSQPPF